MQRAESPRIIGITGVSRLEPVSSPCSLARFKKRAALRHSRACAAARTRRIRSAASAAAAVAGGEAAEKTRPGVVYLR